MIRDRDYQAPGSGKLLGTCTELAERTGMPVSLVRIAAVVALVWAFKLTVVAYCLGALIFRAERR